MGQDLLIGVILLGIAAVLIFFGLPDKEGVNRRFLRFEAAVILYPVWSKYWSEASISSIANLIALITVPVPHRRPG